MKQREIKDSNNLTWQCVQPFSKNKETEELVRDKIEDDNSEIEIVCTPSKAAQSVRIKVDKNWMENLSDDDLAEKIKSNHTPPNQ